MNRVRLTTWGRDDLFLSVDSDGDVVFEPENQPDFIVDAGELRAALCRLEVLPESPDAPVSVDWRTPETSPDLEAVRTSLRALASRVTDIETLIAPTVAWARKVTQDYPGSVDAEGAGGVVGE